MKTFVLCGCGIICVLLSWSVPCEGVAPRASEMRAVLAGGEWANCTHKGSTNVNCTDCVGKIECDEYQQSFSCTTYTNTQTCLKCKTETMPCPGNKIVYPNDGCTGEGVSSGECAARNWTQFNVSSVCDNGVQNCP